MKLIENLQQKHKKFNDSCCKRDASRMEEWRREIIYKLNKCAEVGYSCIEWDESKTNGCLYEWFREEGLVCRQDPKPGVLSILFPVSGYYEGAGQTKLSGSQ